VSATHLSTPEGRKAEPAYSWLDRESSPV